MAESTEFGPSSQPFQFGQLLASNDKVTRDKAVKSLTRHLKRSPHIDELELMRIWKALFYCMWHSDKPKVQAELAETLGALVHAARGGKHWLFIRVFWATMVREWPGLDRLRLNKFYQLLGRQLHHSIRLLAATGWAADDARRLGAIWKEGPLAAASPAGLKYFLIDTIVGALREEWRADADADAGADAGGGGGGSDDGLLALLEPFCWLLGAAREGIVVQKVEEKVVEPLLAAAAADGGGEEPRIDELEEEEEEGSDGEAAAPERPLPVDLAQLAEALFAVASGADARETNRPRLYALQQRVEEAAGAPAADDAPAARDGAAPRADPSQVDRLRKLMGGGGGKKKAKRERDAAAAADDAPPAPKGKKGKRADAPPPAAEAPEPEAMPDLNETLRAIAKGRAKQGEGAAKQGAAPKKPKKLKPKRLVE